MSFTYDFFRSTLELIPSRTRLSFARIHPFYTWLTVPMSTRGDPKEIIIVWLLNSIRHTYSPRFPVTTQHFRRHPFVLLTGSSTLLHSYWNLPPGLLTHPSWFSNSLQRLHVMTRNLTIQEALLWNGFHGHATLLKYSSQSQVEWKLT